MLEETYPIRTDLALESQERLKKNRGTVKGVNFQEEEREGGVVVSTVIIETENAARAMGRPRGTGGGAGGKRGRGDSERACKAL